MIDEWLKYHFTLRSGEWTRTNCKRKCIYGVLHTQHRFVSIEDLTVETCWDRYFFDNRSLLPTKFQEEKTCCDWLFLKVILIFNKQSCKSQKSRLISTILSWSHSEHQHLRKFPHFQKVKSLGLKWDWLFLVETSRPTELILQISTKFSHTIYFASLIPQKIAYFSYFCVSW